jgi:hypothetical protein
MGDKTSSSIRLDETSGRIIVSGLECDNEEIFDFFSGLPEEQREERFLAALKMGVVALKTMGTAQEMVYVEKCFNVMLDEFTVKLDGALGEKGTVKDLVDKYFGDRGVVTEMVEDTFGDDGAFSKHLKDTFGPDGKIIKEVFDPSREGTPLWELKKEIAYQFTELRKDFAAAKKEREVVSKTAIKGKEFEEDLWNMIGGLAEHQGDKVERAGDQPGRLAPSKKGDFIVTLSNNPDLKIVFESKDTGGIGFPAMERELKEAMENRAASYGIFVAKSLSGLPTGVGWFNEYNGNMLAIALGEGDESDLREEILKIAYRWARLRLLSGEGREIEGIDSSFLHEKIDEARRRLKELSTVKSSCTKAIDHIQTIKDSVEETMSSLKEILNEVLEEIDRVTGQEE